MVPYCTPDLVQKLQPAKNRLKEIADVKAEMKKKNGLNPSVPFNGEISEIKVLAVSFIVGSRLKRKF